METATGKSHSRGYSRPESRSFPIRRPEDPVLRDGDMECECGSDWTENVVLKREVLRSRRAHEG
jgi:hypothetical protein